MTLMSLTHYHCSSNLIQMAEGFLFFLPCKELLLSFEQVIFASQVDHLSSKSSHTLLKFFYFALNLRQSLLSIISFFCCPVCSYDTGHDPSYTRICQYFKPWHRLAYITFIYFSCLTLSDNSSSTSNCNPPFEDFYELISMFTVLLPWGKRGLCERQANAKSCLIQETAMLLFVKLLLPKTEFKSANLISCLLANITGRW